MAGLEAFTEEYTDALLDLVAYLHPAVDPDTGHHVCHRHGLGAAVLRASGRAVPALVVGGCLLLVEGEEPVRAVLGEARPAGLEEWGEERARVGGVLVDSYWLSQALRAAGELRARAGLYLVGMEGEDWVAVHLEWRGGSALALVPPRCSGEERIQRGSQSFYQ
ncbi:MAG: hypothetical protein GSR80_000902 [Desulfurococcales archaeon]|nr:hypothetical protein [Desulfurococcales archaeon]